MSPERSTSDDLPDRPSGDEDLLIDWLHGELEATEAARLEARLAAEPALEATRRSLERVLGVDAAVFQGEADRQRLEADAPRLAAWIRTQAQGAETARTAYRPRARARRGWARVLAFSVALHVVALGIIAFLTRGEVRTEERATPQISFNPDAFREYEPDPVDLERALRYQGATEDDGDLLADGVVLAEQETLPDELPSSEDGSGASFHRALKHPVGVVVPMSRRLHDALKRRRLNLLGFNSQGTMRAVERGLRFLAGRQKSGGWYEGGDARGSVQQTGLALLAFLADGHSSTDRRGGRYAQVVDRGTTWLRTTLFPPTRRAELGTYSTAELGLAALVLSEDYMLGYGWFSTAESQARVSEIAELASALRTRLDESPDASRGERPWGVWALDAARRARVIQPVEADRRLFSDWVVTASTGVANVLHETPLAAFTAGTALLFQERGADKPRFRSWSRTNAEALVKRLDARGQARSGDPIGDTALILLSLQVPYRTY